jgi:hypothetical protein
MCRPELGASRSDEAGWASNFQYRTMNVQFLKKFHHEGKAQMLTADDADGRG